MNHQCTCANNPKQKTKTKINLPLQMILTLPAPGMSPAKKIKEKWKQKSARMQQKHKSTNQPTGWPITNLPAPGRKTQEKQPQEFTRACRKTTMNNQPTCANNPKHKTKETINLPLQTIWHLQKIKEKQIQQLTRVHKIRTNEPTCANGLISRSSGLQNGPSRLGNGWSSQSDDDYLVGGKGNNLSRKKGNKITV